MNRFATAGLIAATLLAAGCGGHSHLPKPRPADPEVDPAAAPTVAETPPATAASAVTTAAGTAAAARTNPAAGSTEAGAAAIGAADQNEGQTGAVVLADPEALQLQIEPVQRGQTLTTDELRWHSLQRMRKISTALAAYALEHGRLPPPATYDEEGGAMLSWRVLLLPYLGHKDLYARFKLKESFNSPHNARLLAAIPPVFQSPDRPDEKTNYLVPMFAGGAFHSRLRDGCPVDSVRDGLANTVLLVEVDHAMAVPWTRPIDYTVYPQDPQRGLGSLRDNGFLLGWGDGTVGFWPASAPAAQFPALFTIAGGESGVRESSVAVVVPSPPVADDDTAILTAADGNGGPEPTPSGASIDALFGAVIAEDSPAALSTTAAEPSRAAPPLSSTRARLLEVVREAYAEQYKELVSVDQQRAFAQRLMAEAGKSQVVPDERFVLLEVACKVATHAGDIHTALRAIERLEIDFEIEPLAWQAEVLQRTVNMPLDETQNRLALETAEGLIDAALTNDQFDHALQMQGIALAAARRGKDQRQIVHLAQRRSEIIAARRHFDRVRHALGAVHSGVADAEMNLTVGTYLCFVRNQWSRGLPLLAAGADSRLASLAQTDIAEPVTPGAQIALADRWWDVAEDHPQYRRGCRQRADHWYGQALSRLPDGLHRVKAELRRQEFQRD